MSLQIGQTLQTCYRIDALLGQGGMGAVYKAFDTRLNNYCAVKEMLPDPTASAQALQQARAQFQKEAQVLASLDHPNLPRVRDYFSLWGNEYLVMDFVEGENLDEVMTRVGGALGEKQVLAWADQILDALEYLHEQQPFAIIHRDVKPLNIILTPGGKVKLVDFGLVKLLDPTDPRTATIMRGMGTPEYAPLEQFAGGMHTDARTDIFALGATLYHLLTGQPPVEVHQRMLNVQQLAPPRQLNPYISARTEQALLRALEVYPDKRWQTAREMRAALARPTTGMSKGIWQYGLAGVGVMVLLFLGWWGVRGWFAPRPMATTMVVVVAPSATLTVTATATLAPLTATDTPRSTDTATPVPSTATNTPRPTDTATSVPPTVTDTPRPTNTATPVPPTATDTPRLVDTVTPSPPTDTLAAGNLYEDMVYVPAGNFIMGDWGNEQTIYLNKFWIDKYEVTNAQYMKCVEAGVCKEPRNIYNFTQSSHAKHPVVWVDWYDADTYCRWAGKRLPTTQEWEKAARGTDGRTLPWKEQDWSGLDETIVERLQGSSMVAGVREETAPIGSFPSGASPYEAMDMLGNVWEWVAEKHLKGGSFNSFFVHGNYGAVRVWTQHHAPADDTNNSIGFRCAR